MQQRSPDCDNLNLNSLPDDVLKKVEKFLPKSARAKLATTSSHLYQYGLDLTIHGFFNSHNTRIRAHREQVQKFLNHVIKAEQDEAEEMLNQNPDLLYEKGTVKDHVGRVYQEYTAMQLAHATGDIALYPEEGHIDMADMLKLHFVEVYSSEDLAEQVITEQIREKFPEGAEQGRPFDFEPIFNAINNATPYQVQEALNLTGVRTPLWQDLENFRAAFKNLSLQELRVNHHHLLAAFQLHDCQYGNFKNAACHRLYMRQVIGFVQYYFSMCKLKALAQGIFQMVGHKEPRQQTFIFRNGGGDIASLLTSGQLGSTCWVTRGGGASDNRGKPPSDRPSPMQTICEQEERAWQTLCKSDVRPDRCETKSSRCSVM